MILGLIYGIVLGFLFGLPFSAIVYFAKTKKKLSSFSLKWWFDFIYLWQGALWSIMGLFVGISVGIFVYVLTFIDAFVIFLIFGGCAVGSIYGTMVSMRKFVKKVK